MEEDDKLEHLTIGNGKISDAVAEAIVKATGETPSERYLAALGENSFLNLWSYPNVFFDKKQGGKGHGKELCDLLVVCGDHVLIFSDKSIACQSYEDLNLSWTRWYRSAVSDSVNQVNGAIRRIKQFPDKIFLDRDCTVPFPIKFPSPDKIKFHGIVVALGSQEVCKKYFKGGSGSLQILPNLIGGDHTDTQKEGFVPFSIGDVNSGKEFIHVFDDVTLDVVMRELDTIADMTEYLDKKAKFIRSGILLHAYGEEDLLAYYVVNFSKEGRERDFFNLKGEPWKDGEHLAIDEGVFHGLYINPGYLAKKEADAKSYIWDGLILNFTTYMLKGEMAEIEEQPYEFKESEKVLRHMAFENRFKRRVHGLAIEEISKSYKKEMARLCRAMLPAPTEDSKTGYVFLMLKYPEDLEFPSGYEEYRKYRRALLSAYCFFHANQQRHLERVIGIATEPPSEVTGRPGSSEELLMVEIPEWTKELSNQAIEGAKVAGIGKPENVRLKKTSEQEFPDVPFSDMFFDSAEASFGGNALNRKQRRALKAKKRRAT